MIFEIKKEFLNSNKFTFKLFIDGLEINPSPIFVSSNRIKYFEENLRGLIVWEIFKDFYICHTFNRGLFTINSIQEL
jgi:hypothetical protein